MIRVDTIGELRGMKLEDFPSRGIVLDADTISLRGFTLLNQKVDLVPAGALERIRLELCGCDHWDGLCPACRFVEKVRASGMVEGSP